VLECDGILVALVGLLLSFALWSDPPDDEVAVLYPDILNNNSVAGVPGGSSAFKDLLSSFGGVRSIDIVTVVLYQCSEILW
jgi:hypothetical protein